MTDHITAMKQALEALQKIADQTYDEWTNGAEAGRIARAAITSLRAAQAQQHAPAAAPAAAREPLKHMQIVRLWGHRSDGPSTAELVSFARAIERAHGIGGEA